MARMGRPRKKDEDKIKYHMISIDKDDYLELKEYCLKNNTKIKLVIKEFIANL